MMLVGKKGWTIREFRERDIGMRMRSVLSVWMSRRMMGWVVMGIVQTNIGELLQLSGVDSTTHMNTGNIVE
jgi:hypothetical protein